MKKKILIALFLINQIIMAGFGAMYEKELTEAGFKVKKDETITFISNRYNDYITSNYNFIKSSSGQIITDLIKNRTFGNNKYTTEKVDGNIIHIGYSDILKNEAKITVFEYIIVISQTSLENRSLMEQLDFFDVIEKAVEK